MFAAIFLINWFYNLDIHIFVFYNMALFSSVMALTNSCNYFNSDEKYHGLSYGIIHMLSTDMKIKSIGINPTLFAPRA